MPRGNYVPLRNEKDMSLREEDSTFCRCVQCWVLRCCGEGNVLGFRCVSPIHPSIHHPSIHPSSSRRLHPGCGILGSHRYETPRLTLRRSRKPPRRNYWGVSGKIFNATHFNWQKMSLESVLCPVCIIHIAKHLFTNTNRLQTNMLWFFLLYCHWIPYCYW